MFRYPTISIVTGTLNSHIPTFKRVLDSIKMQAYPRALIEHIVVDGGSTNGTVELAKNYGCKVIIRSDIMAEDAGRFGFMINTAKREIILVLESDNILPTKDWLERMVKPFLENKNIFCTFSAYNGYEKDMKATTKYCALFGSPDPTLYYLKKTEKIRLDQKHYNKGEILRETDDYYAVRFTKDNLPTLGDNGHLFLRRVINKLDQDPYKFIHVDAFSELVEMGYNTFGVVKNSIIHVMSSHLMDYVKRRMEVKGIFYDSKRGERKYLTFNWSSKQDQINLLKYITFSLTFIIPFLESLKGYLKIREKAWFLHPFICFVMVIGYGWSEIQWQFKQAVKKLRV